MAKRLYNSEEKKIYYVENKETILAKSKKRYALNRSKYKFRAWLQRLRYEFGLGTNNKETYLAYIRMQVNQDWVCAICKKPEIKKDPQNGKITRLAVDHCHDTLKIRGLLCFQCNTKLGWFTANMGSVLKYLKMELP